MIFDVNKEIENELQLEIAGRKKKTADHVARRSR